MKQLFVLAGLLMPCSAVVAQTAEPVARPDSVRMVQMESIRVSATRATERTPVAFTDLKAATIAAQNFGQDLPYLLQTTPSVVVTSDAGAGIGYTSVRIRGTDATRINVTANGIPMNDAESHNLYWVNMPDFASSAGEVQIQRGVGTSVNGAGAFGGSINIRTESAAIRPYAEIDGSYGSFNTHKETVKIGTGLMGGKWAVDARLSNIGSDGYIDRASTRLQSYFLQGAYYGPTTVVKLITFAGKEKTYHAWNGIDKDMLATNRRYNTCGEILDDEGNVVGFYKDQTDNYIQSNYQIHVLQRLGAGWQMNVALHLTKGDGYYEEYKNKRTLEEYGLQPFVVVNPDGTTGEVTKSDLVRRKMMDNIFGGGVFSFDMQHERLQLSVGGAVNSYGGNHFGRVIWVKKYAATDLAPDHEYYRNKGTKNDANIYVKAHWEVARRLFLYGDMQYRRISYRIHGANDNWDWNAGAMQSLDVNEKYDFFNPKGGIMYNINKNLNVYASVAVAHKEPTRNNFTDAGLDAKPRPERLIDYEAGVAYNGKRVNASANLYYMRYRDQLVLTGEVNHIGEPLADNVKDSYRAGVELAAGVQIAKWLRWDLNATLSLNRILGYTEYLDNYDTDWNSLYTQTANYLGTTTISFSPSVIAGSLISFNLNGWSAAFQSNYVGKQYLSNSERDDLSLDAYFVNNLRVDYSFKLRSLRTLSVGVAINNIFNAMYCSNGGGSSSYLVSGDAHERYDSAWYFPQAGINFMVGIKIKL